MAWSLPAGQSRQALGEDPEMRVENEAIGLACDGCGEQQTMSQDEARFTFAALSEWCCPRCLTLQPWPVHLLDERNTDQTRFT
jgi:hypothetical protein